MTEILDPHLADFEQNRRTVFGIAYRMLGSVADAEDLVQDTWLRWNGVTEAVASPGAYLTRTVTNLALNKLTSATARRESYVGPWLPEPLVDEPDAAEGVERAESVSMAMLVVMESLSPLERAVFVLKEAFGYSYQEIAEALDRTETACRRIGSRAKAHVSARRPRYDAPSELRRRATDEFLAACVGGDLNRVLELLAPEVTTWSDGGGVVRAALRPVVGAEKTARFLLGLMSRYAANAGARPVLVNGQPGLLFTLDGALDSVVVLDLDLDLDEAQGPEEPERPEGLEGPETPERPEGSERCLARISAIRVVRNPEKLAHLAVPATRA
ncbi:RNA polymerase sigma factor SigJ [Kitasatospora sp. NPDC051170]|uniref:RNA polymerase sigma factor SigJ n=1 Tax=Kitasatospora sp. NPDC051170 TaxID=3364056 RepID=UPI0037B8F28A